MQKLFSFAALLLAMAGPAIAQAEADFYRGDTLIYSGSPISSPRPNILFIIDNNLTMTMPVTSADFDPDRAESPEATRIEIVRNAIEMAVGEAKNRVNIGLMVFAGSGKGGQLVTPVQNLSSADSFKRKFINLLPGTPTTGATIIPDTSRPLAEALLEARYYFDTDRTSSISPISLQPLPNSPITEACQKNILIFISNGGSVGDSDSHICEVLGQAGNEFSSLPRGDYDGDDHPGDTCSENVHGRGTHLFDDVAKYAYDTDLSFILADSPGIQRLETHILQVFSAHDPLLEAAAINGHGSYHILNTAEQISTALAGVINPLLFEVDSSFTAPVVPLDPQSQSSSGQQVLIGFFSPVNGYPWKGNLKKFGFSPSGEIIDATGVRATDSDGRFRDADIAGDYTASSYWSSEDAGRVTEGGVGEVLLQRGFSNDTDFQISLDEEATNPLPAPSRNLYTYLTSGNSSIAASNESRELTQPQNRFYSGNRYIAHDTTLALRDDQEKDKLIAYVHGLDSYDDDADGSIIDLRGDDPGTVANEEWVLGDILHSRPLVVNYSRYPETAANEADCSVNLATVFVGTNDGMLHAFRSCDGQERWAFIPPELLPELHHLRGPQHRYFVDGSPAAYIFDANRDGHIDASGGDKVLLLFGLRRGGHSYYALDVTEPDAPVYLWKISRDQFPVLSESWATPQIGRVKTSSGTSKIVAFIGAGYDNLREDGRFGSTQSFSDTNPGSSLASLGAVTSSTISTTSDLQAPGGRGVLAFEIARLDANGVPTLARSARLVWGFQHFASDTESQTSQLRYSFPAEPTILDTDGDGHIDRLYAGDTGGQLWRLSQGDRNSDINLIDGPEGNNGWSAERIFFANAGYDGTTGRKIFYRPSVTLEPGGRVNLYFGTGDRAHPLNTAVVDRIYAVYDRGQTTASAINEDNLVRVTENLLQENSTSAEERTTLLRELFAETNYGWFIELNQAERPGEKILSPAVTFNRVCYQTSFTPAMDVADPCNPEELGFSKLYALDYLTGEAVLNLAEDNDSSATGDNPRARSDEGAVLRREDRSTPQGIGITSGTVITITRTGEKQVLVGCNGGICSINPVSGGTLYPIYWRSY